MSENRVVVASESWADTIPDWLMKEIEVERLMEVFGMIDRKEKVGDAEACVYYYTLSCVQPLSSENTKIYFYLATKLMKKSKGVDVPEDIAVESLSEYETTLLNDLKGKLWRTRGGKIKSVIGDLMSAFKKECEKSDG